MFREQDSVGKQLAFYYQKNNTLFDGSVLAVCYKANEDEIKHYNLTSENILIFIKSPKLENLSKKTDVDYRKEIQLAFQNQDIFLRAQCECLLGMYGDSHCDCEEQRLDSISTIADKGGIYIHMPQEAQGWGLFYKLKELELQVSGRDESGKFVGQKSRDEAQNLLLGNHKFDDLRSYDIIVKILDLLGLRDYKFVFITESDKKYNALVKLGLNVTKITQYQKENVTPDNISEYLIKILNSTHDYDQNIIDKIIELIEQRKYNERTLSTLTSIVDKINNDKDYKLANETKNKLLKAYDYIICGEEKRYILANGIKIQNHFSCKVNSSIFKAIQNIYGYDVFDRISMEKLHYFEGKQNKNAIRIRSSRVLDTISTGSIFLKGQVHVQRRDFNEDGTQILQREVSLSNLRAFFENSNHDYLKRVEMITMISEGRIPGVNIYIKRIPNIDSRILDVFGKKDAIRKFIKNVTTSLTAPVFNEPVSNMNYEEENFDEHNLKFADLKTAINEELSIYELLKSNEE